MANPGDLSTRVHAVLNSRQQRGPAGVWVRITATIAAVASVALLAPLRTVASALGQTPAGSRAQTSAEPTARPQFEVASIKPSPSFDRIMSVRPLPGRLTADATLQVLMQYAYGVQPFQLVGGPRWLTSDHYEIEAKADVSADRDRVFRMLQALLEDRFQLKTHREMKTAGVCARVEQRWLHAPGTEGRRAWTHHRTRLWNGSGLEEWPLRESFHRPRGVAVLRSSSVGQMRGGKIAMSEFVRALSMMLGRRVLDKTGFTAPFDLRLDFVPDDTTPAMPPPPPGSGISGISISQALQEQLGLRLESTKGPVEVIVVDQAERPSDN